MAPTLTRPRPRPRPSTLDPTPAVTLDPTPILDPTRPPTVAVAVTQAHRPPDLQRWQPRGGSRHE